LDKTVQHPLYLIDLLIKFMYRKNKVFVHLLEIISL